MTSWLATRRVHRRVMKLVLEQKLGIAVDQCIVETRQPRQLDMAFQAVTDAGIRSGIAQTDARSYRDRKLNEAEGNAAARINVARAESNDMVAKIKGDAAIFNNVLPSYRRNPELGLRISLASNER